ncbi:MAG: hypothetical protein QM805_07650 [Pseudomonas sp.]
MARATFQGLVRSYSGGTKEDSTSPGVMVQAVVISFNPTNAGATPVRIGTSATAGAVFTLPKGAVPISFLSLGGATGGSSPTVDIGTAATPDGFFNEADADTKGTLANAAGTLVVPGGIPAAVVVTGRVGASAAAGGTTSGVFTYTVVDDGYESA